MGQKEKALVRVVLDSNVLISSLLFKGQLSRMVTLWKAKQIIPLISQETFEELLAVLNYPKFSLSEREAETILSREILPYFEVVHNVESQNIGCRDPEDEKFVSCAISGKASFLITGDRDLLHLKHVKSVKIVSPAEFLRKLE